MLSPNQIYDYLRYYCYTNKKNAVVLSPLNIGTKKLTDFGTAHSPYIETSTSIQDPTVNGNKFRESNGCIMMYDQEPLDIEAYHNASYSMVLEDTDFRKALNPIDFVCSRSMAIYTPIASVSELNSVDVNILSNNHHTILYFWSNAFTSLYWFQHYELLSKNKSTLSKKRIGCYIRDITGTRKYRLELINFFKTQVDKIFCPVLNPKTINAPSDASATIVWSDCDKFDIQVVPETIFDTSKIHLTEKIFKPIVMYQPFILVSGANSLHYLRSYGFKTFSSLWDESYDTEVDSFKRLQLIKDLISTLIKMDKKEYKSIMEKAQSIVDYNRQYFYSERFKKRISNELNTNLESALHTQEESFYTMPGGTLFYYYDLYFKKTGKLPTSKSFIISSNNALSYAYSKSRKVGDTITKKYKHLL